VEYAVYERYVAQSPFFLRPFFLLDIAKLRGSEKMFWKKAKKLVAVSEVERKEMERDDVAVVPNGVDLDKFKMQNVKLKVQKENQRILYIGDFKWIENQDAASFIMQDVWPLIKKKMSNATLWIVGKNIPEKMKHMIDDKRILFDENANDTAAIFRDASILLAPIRVGGGTSFKILEAMATGVPVVTTPLGASGIMAKDKEHVRIGVSREALAEATVEILTNPQIAATLTKNARALIEKEYTWQRSADLLESVYQSAV
jgi:glycosyltransferase involved in cell wall biosynthesis